ncbi:MAG: 5'/3'-nucleotidase SurE [Acidobacteriota bacterium]
MAKPRILVTNDDGYTSEGIQVLADALEGLAEVWVVAPNSEQSAVSHALTLDRPLRIERLGEHRISVDGTPTDCVAIAVSNLMNGDEPDLVVSGINFGYNMGADVHYSGTVSAAFEGVILGVPAMAVSLGVGEGLSFHLAAKFARDVARWILDNGLPRNTLLNINVPVGTPLGVKLTRLGVRRYTEGVIEETDPRGRRIFWIGGGQPVWEPIPDTDFHEVASGYVSVTPLHLDMTDRRSLDRMRERAPSWVESIGGEDI